MLGERIVSQSEVIRAIVSGYSPCCGGAHRRARATAKGTRRTPSPRTPLPQLRDHHRQVIPLGGAGTLIGRFWRAHSEVIRAI